MLADANLQNIHKQVIFTAQLFVVQIIRHWVFLLCIIAYCFFGIAAFGDFLVLSVCPDAKTNN